MLSRSSLCRGAQSAVRTTVQHQTRRGLAAPASGSFSYETGDASGIKYAARDIPGPVATLAIVAKAGTRYETLPGVTEGLQRYAFKHTERRSTLRIQRESELLGSALQSFHTREGLVIGAKFLRDDLPYFVELLAEVASLTKYEQYVFDEEIYPLIKMSQQKLLADPTALAQNSAHALAFHRGLGNSLSPSSSTPLTKYLDAETVEHFARIAYSKPQFAVVANGAESATLSKWINEFFTDIPAQPVESLKSTQSKYYGGEERIAHASGNSMVLAFPGSSSPTGGSFKPEIAVLAELLGGVSTIKWNSGFSLLAKAKGNAIGLSIKTKSDIYSDAGLLSVTISGSANDVRRTAQSTVDALKTIAGGVSKEEFAKAKALAKFRELEYGQETQSALELTGSGLVSHGKAYQIDEVAKSVDGVTEAQVKKAAKEALEGKATVSTVGDLFVLPYAEEIGLKV